jgi:hypothetical protein
MVKKKKTSGVYFTQATEDSIVKYNNCDDFAEKSKIYENYNSY